MKMLFALLISFTPTDSLPSDSLLCASVRTHYAAIEAAEIEVLKNEKQHWTNWLPSVGIGYNLQGQPRPTLSYSLAPVAQVFLKKQERANQRESIRLKYAEFVRSECAAIGIERAAIEIQTAQWERDTARFSDERDLYAIWEKKYEKTEITPSEFLPKKIAFEGKKSVLENRKIEIEMRNLELLKSAYWFQL